MEKGSGEGERESGVSEKKKKRERERDLARIYWMDWTGLKGSVELDCGGWSLLLKEKSCQQQSRVVGRSVSPLLNPNVVRSAMGMDAFGE